MSTNKKFDHKKASLTEFNRELKRLASRKCRAKNDDEKSKFENEYKKLVEIKNKKFETSRKSYLTYTDEEIQKMSLEDTIKAIKSLQSIRCVYKDRTMEVLPIEEKYQNHRQDLLERQKYEELKNKFE